MPSVAAVQELEWRPQLDVSRAPPVEARQLNQSVDSAQSPAQGIHRMMPPGHIELSLTAKRTRAMRHASAGRAPKSSITGVAAVRPVKSVLVIDVGGTSVKISCNRASETSIVPLWTNSDPRVRNTKLCA